MQNFMDNWLAIRNMVLVFLFFILPVSALALLLGYLPSSIRSYKLSRFAKRNSLFFDNSMNKFSIFGNQNIKRNIIKGEINNHQILIYDYMDPAGYFIPFVINYGAFVPKRITVFSIDGNQREIKSYFIRYASSRKLQKIIENLKLGNPGYFNSFKEIDV
jgi:hypothetical protein